MLVVTMMKLIVVISLVELVEVMIVVVAVPWSVKLLRILGSKQLWVPYKPIGMVLMTRETEQR